MDAGQKRVSSGVITPLSSTASAETDLKMEPGSNASDIALTVSDPTSDSLMLDGSM